mmetsp:Transcript_21052/g.33778  ORF Transcript_21052/g.33778 Transcript_21052/m.33778 type:complete len:270 (+) Transcript_21052:192-1001(+)
MQRELHIGTMVVVLDDAVRANAGFTLIALNFDCLIVIVTVTVVVRTFCTRHALLATFAPQQLECARLIIIISIVVVRVTRQRRTTTTTLLQLLLLHLDRRYIVIAQRNIVIAVVKHLIHDTRVLCGAAQQLRLQHLIVGVLRQFLLQTMIERRGIVIGTATVLTEFESFLGRGRNHVRTTHQLLVVVVHKSLGGRVQLVAMEFTAMVGRITITSVRMTMTTTTIRRVQTAADTVTTLRRQQIIAVEVAIDRMRDWRDGMDTFTFARTQG